MTTIINPSDVKVIQEGDGWILLGLADRSSFGSPAMVARRWIFAADARGPELIHGDHDQLLYVIRGGGLAQVDDEEFPLADESVLWVDPGQRCRFVAGPDGLEILQGYAPGE